MTKRIISCLAVLLVLLVLPASAPFTSGAAAVEKQSSADENFGVRKARFETMLNHNYVYDDDFSSDRTIIENAILALLDHAENDEIDRELVLHFIRNMYGREVDPNAAVYDFLPASEGKFAVLARGYSKISHTVLSVEEVAGGWEVVSEMRIEPHDGQAYTVSANTLFVANEGSSFGYNIVRSDLESIGDNLAV